MKKLFIIVNVDWFFLSHRLPVALAAQKAGWDVTIVTADTGNPADVTVWYEPERRIRYTAVSTEAIQTREA